MSTRASGLVRVGKGRKGVKHKKGKGNLGREAAKETVINERRISTGPNGHLLIITLQLEEEHQNACIKYMLLAAFCVRLFICYIFCSVFQTI